MTTKKGDAMFSLVSFQQQLYNQFEECEGRQRKEKMLKHRMGKAVGKLVEQHGYERLQAWQIVQDARDVYELERDAE